MRCKSLLAFIFFIGTAIILNFGCKKEDRSPVQVSQSKSKSKERNSALIEKSKALFNAQRNNSSIAARSRYGNYAVLWDSAWTTSQGEHSIVQCPLKFPQEPGFIMLRDDQDSSGITPEAKIRLVIVQNNSDSSMRIFLMNVVSSDDRYPDIEYMVTGTNFSGYVFFTNLIGEFVNGWVYEDGVVTRASKIENRMSGKAKAPGEGGGGGEECYTVVTYWFTRDCIEYWNGYIDCDKWEYLETTYQTYCLLTGGGGGGGLGGFEDKDEPEVITYLETDNTSDISTAGVESTDPNTGITKKLVGHEWGLCNVTQIGSFGGVYKMEYRSLETANLEKANPNAVWKYTSLVHDGISVSGTSRPDYSVSHQLNQALPIYAPDMCSAQMSINFSISFVANGSGQNYYNTVSKTSPNWIAQ